MTETTQTLNGYVSIGDTIIFDKQSIKLFENLVEQTKEYLHERGDDFVAFSLGWLMASTEAYGLGDAQGLDIPALEDGFHAWSFFHSIAREDNTEVEDLINGMTVLTGAVARTKEVRHYM